MTPQDQAIEQAEKVRVQVGTALAAIPGLSIDPDDITDFTVNGYGAPTLMDAFWEDAPRDEGWGPNVRYWVTAAVVTWLDAPRPLGDGYVEVVQVDWGAPENEPSCTALPMTFVAAADLGDGEPLARLAVDAIRAHRASVIR